MNDGAATEAEKSIADGGAVEAIKGLLSKPEAGPLALLVGAIIAFTLLSGTFFSVGNISNLMAFTPELGMIALAMTLLMTSGEFDLSVGSVFGFAAVVMWTVANETTLGIEVGFVIAMVVGVTIGLVNGWFVTRLRVPSFLVTLGMLLVVRGMALYLTQRVPATNLEGRVAAPRQSSSVTSFVPTPFGDLRVFMSIFWFALFAIVLGYILMASRFGNWIQAAGGNPRSCVGAWRARVARQGFALRADRGDGRLRWHHQLHPRVDRQPQLRHGL